MRDLKRFGEVYDIQILEELCDTKLIYSTQNDT